MAWNERNKRRVEASSRPMAHIVGLRVRKHGAEELDQLEVVLPYHEALHLSGALLDYLQADMHPHRSGAADRAAVMLRVDVKAATISVHEGESGSRLAWSRLLDRFTRRTDLVST